MNAKQVLARQDFHLLLDAIRGSGYRLIGPTIREGAIVYEEIHSVKDLPEGWTEEQSKASYRLKKRNDSALFGYTVGPQSWKKYLYPQIVRLWKAHRKNGGFEIKPEAIQPEKLALLGVRPCDLQAIAIQDKIFLKGTYVDPVYQANRSKAFIVAVNCTEAGGSCFCESMKTGPQASGCYDLAVTEFVSQQRHEFVIEAGTDAGIEMIRSLPLKEYRAEDFAKPKVMMGRTVNQTALKDTLYWNYENRCWDQVAERCLSCGNCTLVCPTCFCTTVEDYTSLKGDTAERLRRWDSCFTMDFSYIHGGSIRASVQSRYRQWLMHKMAAWVDQFGTSGCTGCGRCITWCPAGIDLTQEVLSIQQTDATHNASNEEKQT